MIILAQIFLSPLNYFLFCMLLYHVLQLILPFRILLIALLHLILLSVSRLDWNSIESESENNSSLNSTKCNTPSSVVSLDPPPPPKVTNLLNKFPTDTIKTPPCTWPTVGVLYTPMAAVQTCHNLEGEGVVCGLE